MTDEQIHIAAWPLLFPHAGHEHYGITAGGADAISRTYAAESGAFVLCPTQVITEEGASSFLLPDSKGFLQLPGGGSSAIYGPDGARLSAAQSPTYQGVISVDLDMSLIAKAKSLADPVGVSSPQIAQSNA